jgi:hypothetical protein
MTHAQPIYPCPDISSEPSYGSNTPPLRARNKWTAPVYGATIQHAIEDDITEPITATTRKYLQQVIGTLLYYARAVDNTMQVAISTLSSVQATGTEATMDAVVHLLN